MQKQKETNYYLINERFTVKNDKFIFLCRKGLKKFLTMR